MGNELSDREIGRFEERLEEARHKLRNHQMILDILDSNAEELKCSQEKQLQELRADLRQLKARLWSVISAVGIVATIVGWAAQMAISLLSIN